MATKNIARTAIEGGRVKATRQEEHENHVSERLRAKEYCRKAKYDDVYAENASIEPREENIYGREFHDKLEPVKKWLLAHVGKPWDMVYSELCRKFDRRTTPGRHIIYDHILNGYVNSRRKEPVYYKSVIYDRPWSRELDHPKNTQVKIGYRWVQMSYYDFEIDEAGILRDNSRK